MLQIFWALICIAAAQDTCLTRYGPANGRRPFPITPHTVTSTLTQTRTQCAASTTISSTRTTTIYTGTYNPPQSTLAIQRRDRMHVQHWHNVGQSVDRKNHVAFQIDCSSQQTITVLATTTNRNCTATIRPPVVTITQDKRCEATNMITTVNGLPIDGAAMGIPTFIGLDDPSICCQICLDTPYCGAMIFDAGSRNCILSTPEERCGLSLEYYHNKDDPNITGNGSYVQAGCGYIQAE